MLIGAFASKSKLNVDWILWSWMYTFDTTKVHSFWGDFLDAPANSINWCSSHLHVLNMHPFQWFLFSRSISYVTPKIIYFHYLVKYFLDQSIPPKKKRIRSREEVNNLTASATYSTGNAALGKLCTQLNAHAHLTFGRDIRETKCLEAVLMVTLNTANIETLPCYS